MTTELEARYADYVQAFNAHDFTALERYLAPDVVFEWGDVMPDLIGRDQFFTFYRTAWTYFDETIEARVLSSEGDTLTAWIDTRLTIIRDWPDCPIQPYVAGEVHNVNGEVVYQFRDGLITHLA
ncbi:MAG: nuclear transport factor 2 family protein [Pseudolysinimonas sp.]